MKKILFVIGSLKAGGAEKVLTELLKGLSNYKCEMTVVPIWNEGVYLDEVRKYAKVKGFLPPLNNNKSCIFVKSLLVRLMCVLPAPLLYKLAIKGKYDFEVAFTEGMSTKIVSGSKKQTVKKLAWVHTDLIAFPYSSLSYQYLSTERETYLKFNDVYCVSTQVKERFEQKFNITAKVQFNLYDSYIIRQKAAEVIPDIIDLKSFCYISAGRIVKQKNFDRLLSVHKKLIDDGYNVKLYILGEGILYNSLKATVKDKNLLESVFLLGYESNPYKYIANCHLYVCSSLVEGYSTSVVESILLGTPVVTTDCAGMRDILGDSEFGLITKNTDDGLYQGLKMIITNKQLYHHYKQKTLIKRDSLDLSARLQEFIKIFELS